MYRNIRNRLVQYYCYLASLRQTTITQSFRFTLVCSFFRYRLQCALPSHCTCGYLKSRECVFAIRLSALGFLLLKISIVYRYSTLTKISEKDCPNFRRHPTTEPKRPRCSISIHGTHLELCPHTWSTLSRSTVNRRRRLCVNPALDWSQLMYCWFWIYSETYLILIGQMYGWKSSFYFLNLNIRGKYTTLGNLLPSSWDNIHM